MSGRLARANPPVKPRGQPQYLQPSKQPQPTYSQAQPRNLPPQPPGMMHVAHSSYQQPMYQQPQPQPNQYQQQQPQPNQYQQQQPNQYQQQPNQYQQQQPNQYQQQPNQYQQQQQLSYNPSDHNQMQPPQTQLASPLGKAAQVLSSGQAQLPPTEKRMPTKIGSGPGMVSINDAFAGATLRLSSIEQFILDLKAGSIPIPSDTNMLRGVMSRIEAIEKNLSKLGARLDETHVQTQVIVPTPPEPNRQWNNTQQWPPAQTDLFAEDVNEDTDDEDLQGAVAYEFGAQSQLD